MQEISARITRYVADHLRISRDAADALRREYYLRYGSAVHALVVQHYLDLADFLAFAHDVDVERYLAPDADLNCLLGCIHAPKAIFTNAPRAYAARVLRALGIEQHFVRLFDYEFGDYIGKPDAAVYRRVQAALEEPSDRIVMVDDAVRNLLPARTLGWKTVWVTPIRDDSNPRVDFVVRDLWQIAGAFHQLGVMDAAHRVMAEHRLAGCAWAHKG